MEAALERPLLTSRHWSSVATTASVNFGLLEFRIVLELQV